MDGRDARLRPGAEWLRPSLHLLHHPLWPRADPLGADGRRGRADEALAGNGYREMVLTGVDITVYGADLPGQPSLGKLVQSILRHVPELPRLRISSIDSIEADDALYRGHASDRRLMPHLHLEPAVGRRHDPQAHEAPASAGRHAGVRRQGPGAAAGHGLRRRHHRRLSRPRPTRCSRTRCSIVEEADLTYLHVFPYSPREGTPGRAHAAGRPRRRQGTRRATARGRRPAI